ncbi:hypothetical protein NXX99_26300 [Bacteroides thetaiotaomicron]|nr:hypothetical protein [Bacteroides thetaiotaomicron]
MRHPKKKEPQTGTSRGEFRVLTFRLKAENALLKTKALVESKEILSTSEWARTINELRSDYPFDLLLELRKMARSVFYYHLKRLKAADRYANERKESIKLIFHEHRDTMAIAV